MQLDMVINLGDLLEIVIIIIAGISAFIKFREDLKHKADKDEIIKLNSAIYILTTVTASIDTKINELKKEELKEVKKELKDDMKELKEELKKQKDDYNDLNKIGISLETEHKMNHK
jgi:flagellar biosynthesis component FlhA